MLALASSCQCPKATAAGKRASKNQRQQRTVGRVRLELNAEPKVRANRDAVFARHGDDCRPVVLGDGHRVYVSAIYPL